MNRKKAAQLALAATLAAAAGISGCAAIMASNEPIRIELVGRIRQGMTREEVRAVMGPPDETMRFDRSQTEAWDYRYHDTWGYMAMFSVTFGPDGRVASTLSRRLADGRDGRSN